MMGRTHIAFGLSLWSVLVPVGHRAEWLPFVCAGLGSLLPDIDHPGSMLGRRIPFISYPLTWVVGHRGVTHSLIAVLAAAWGILTLGGNIVALPLLVGYLSHLLGDMMTPSGVPLFWPVRRAVSFNLFKTDSWLEYGLYWALITFLAVREVPMALPIFKAILQPYGG